MNRSSALPCLDSLIGVWWDDAPYLIQDRERGSLSLPIRLCSLCRRAQAYKKAVQSLNDAFSFSVEKTHVFISQHKCADHGKNRRPACAETCSISSIFPMIGQQRASRLLRRINATCGSTRLYLTARILCRGCSTLATEAERGKGCTLFF